MPLKLSTNDVTRIGAHPPVRDQLADHIRQAIATGDLAPGEPIPSEPKLATAAGVDRSTVRFALGVLASEGLIVRTQGKPTIVAAPPKVRRMSTDRYHEQLRMLRDGKGHESTAFVADHDATWDDYDVDPVEYSQETATPADIRYLDLRAGAKVMRRRMVKRIGGEPVQIQRSAVPLSLAKGTVLANKKAQPYQGGTLAELWDAGLIGDGTLKVTEEATGRMPNTTERRLLEMQVPAPVWDIVRVFAVDDRPVEVSRVIAPMARLVLHYETTVS